MTRPIFDDQLRRKRRDRARRRTGDRFLHARAFDDCLDRLGHVHKKFASALVIGRLDARQLAALNAIAPKPHVVDEVGDVMSVTPGTFDLCLVIGGLETVNDLSTAALSLRHALMDGGLLIGAVVGGDSLPRLRAAMLAADRLQGGASPRLHPRIDAPSLAALLGSVGLEMPVIDIDRVNVAYPSLDRLIGDLRTMGCTNVLSDRSLRPFGRRQLDAARHAFLDGRDQAVERFELLHFAAWAPQL